MTSFISKTFTPFNSLAAEYDVNAVLSKEIGARMLQRLEIMTIEPDLILDIGSGTGIFTKLMQRQYPDATSVCLDISFNMLLGAGADSSENFEKICASSERLPFKDNSLSFVCSNLMLPWCEDSLNVLKEVRRVLKPEGVFVFTTLGPDSLKEIYQLFDLGAQSSCFADMHDLGDALLHNGLCDPVMDVEYITLAYKDKNVLLNDLKTQGFDMFLPEGAEALIDSHVSGQFNLSFEVVHGHAWCPLTMGSHDDSGETYIPISQIKKPS